ncbi:MAG TPA: T9SS type A sorting domain-containing protein, partial [Saprospiraceae bacterium]|nr:T9SS type A sorting domain-containing protein [Saprospiraceae bacterium]
NEIRALWFDAAGKRFTPTEALFNLKIRTIQPASLSEMLSLVSQKLVSEAYIRTETGPEQRHAFTLGFGTQQENGAAFFPPRPNPFGDETTFGLLLRQPGTISLEVFDVSGKVVLEQKTEATSGYQSLVLRAADLPGNGVFFYRVRVSGEVFGGRLVRG